MSDKVALLQNQDSEDYEIDFQSDFELEYSKDKNKGTTEEVDIDEFLRRTGECGKYQIISQTLILLAMIPLSFIPFLHYFVGHDPSWKCTNLKHQSNSTVCLAHDNTSRIFEHTSTERCHMNRSEWMFIDEGRSTFVTDFNLVCNRAWLNALAGSVVFIGWGLGIITLGYLSDRYGRKRIMYPAFFLTLLALMFSAFAQSIWQLIIIRFFMGFMFSGPALNNFVLIVELVGPSKRVLASIIHGYSFPIVAFLMTFKAYYIKNWRYLTVACSVPYFISMLTCICVPESVRWLNVTGRRKEAEAILHKAARINRIPVPNISLKKEEDVKCKTSYLDLFNALKMAQLTLSQGYIWFNSGLTFYTLSWAFSDLGGNMYVNFLLAAIVEIPGGIFGYFTLGRFGRKKTAMFAFLFASAFCIGIACIPFAVEYKTFRMVFGLSAKFMITIAFMTAYIWSSEILATSIRTQGMSICIVTSRAGSAMSPFIKNLDTIHPAAPFALVAFTSILATFASCALPETLNQPTKENIEDMFEDKTLTVRAINSLSENNEERLESHRMDENLANLNNYGDEDEGFENVGSVSSHIDSKQRHDQSVSSET